MTGSAAPTDISNAQFERISTMVHSLCGIKLHAGKKELVRARLAKRLRALGMNSFDEYLEHVQNDRADELVAMLDALSTNLTRFFREPEHFAYLTAQVLPALPSHRLRIWSAGCSTGEEPYSIAIQLAEVISDLAHWDVAILATDLSVQALQRAKAGAYEAERLQQVPATLRTRYFAPCTHSDTWEQVKPPIRGMISFARLNLMDRWPMRGPFDVIFCRNVMIYFDKPTQARLIERFWQLLRPGGTLFIGHSESLSGIKHQFSYVQPTVYCKPAAVTAKVA